MGSLVWLVLTVTFQVTILAIVIAVFQSTALRNNAKAAARLYSLSIILLIGVGAAALFPVPSWFDVANNRTWQPELRISVDLEENKSSLATLEEIYTSEASSRDGGLEPQSLAPFTLAERLQDLASQVEARSSNPSSQSSLVSNWVTGIGLLSFALVTIGVIRFSLAGLSLRRLRKSATSVASAETLHLKDELCDKIGFNREVHLYSTPLLSTAATIGFMKPAVFLSADFQDWDREEMESVLAHELAHIHHHDFVANVLSQVCTSLYFFNPVVHWFVARMRLSQEVAADHVAAKITLGREGYAKKLACLALRQDDHRSMRLASMFLPQQNSFIRRIRMLQNAESKSSSRVSGLASVGAILLAVFVCGMRAPTAPAVAQQEKPAKSEKQKKSKAFSTDYVSAAPGRAITFVRPAEILKSSMVTKVLEIEPFKSGATQFEKSFEVSTGIGTSHIEQLVQVSSMIRGEGLDYSYTITRTFEDNLENFKTLGKVIGNERKFPIQLERKRKSTTPMTHGLIVDKRTIIWGYTEKAIELAKEVGKRDATRAKWHRDFKKVAGKSLVLVGPKEFAERTGNDFEPFLSKKQLNQFKKCQGIVAAADVNKDISFEISLEFNLQSEAKAVADFIPDAKKGWMTMLAAAAKSPLESVKSLCNSGITTLKNLDVNTSNGLVKISSDFDLEVKVMMEAGSQMRDAARKTQGMNNQRQIALAMLNYESAYGHFPQATIKHESGEIYSWRIAILPFIEQNEIYENYRFDEPWDSPHNRAATSEMPMVFRHPASESETNTCYFTVVGPKTPFAPGVNVTFADITDGAANTALVVESIRDCHWAKPEDIPFDEATLVETLGGFSEDTFAVVMCNGAVHTLSNDIPPVIFRSFLTAAGEEEIQMSDYLQQKQEKK